jgi:2-dehydropantoate 2-reductase
VIIGAGAIGGTIAGRLAQSSPHLPLLVARGDNADAIERDGLRLRSPDDDTTVRVDVARTPADARLRTDDVLVLATKTQQATAALHEWVDAPVFDEHCVDDPSATPVGTAGELLPILTATNGVATERMALRLFDRVYGVTVWLPSVHLEPGEVIVRIAPQSGTFVVGLPGHGLGTGQGRRRGRAGRTGPAAAGRPGCRLGCCHVHGARRRRRHALEVPQAPVQPPERGAGAPGPGRRLAVGR